MKRIILQILLVVISVVLAFYVWKTIKTPIDFEKERKEYFNETIQKLIEIRTAQIAFKDVNGRFCGDWDSLINFVKYDSIPQIRKIGMLTDEMLEAGLDEKAALQQGLIIRDTIKVSVLDDKFSNNYPINDLKYVPNSENEVFWLGQTIITTGSGVKVPVFEARAHNNQILKKLEGTYAQEIINLNEKSRKNKKYPGLKVGSVSEPNNNAGNWE